MEEFVVGDVVAAYFPFSDLKGHKLRPALVLAEAEFNNVILCQITSKPYSSKIAIKLSKDEFEQGGLPVISYIRPDKLFTADSSIIQKISGRLKTKKKHAVLTAVRKIFTEK